MMNLILTFDYELFGDGSGDVFMDIIEPTKKILDILDLHEIKSTIFFEVIEYWKMKEQWEKGNLMGYKQNPISAIEKQLKEAYTNGHDVQLHLHPQWLNAKWDDNKWHIDRSMWRLGDFTEISGYTLLDLLSDGKKTLEDLFTSINPNYKCHTIRAGGYNISPSNHILAAMKSLEFKCDSSVYPGGFENGYLSQYDYRNIDNKKDFWFVVNDVKTESSYKSGIIELPIFALPSMRIKKFLNKNRFMSFLVNRKSAISNFSSKVHSNKSLYSKILFFFNKEYLTWDFCLFSDSMHNKYFAECLQLNKNHGRSIFTIIGHPKNFINPDSLKSLICRAQKSNMSFLTISFFCDQKNISSDKINR